MKAIKPDIPAGLGVAEAVRRTQSPEHAPVQPAPGADACGDRLARAGLKDSARSVARRSQGDPSIDSNRNLAELATYVYTALGDKGEALKQLSVYIAANPDMRAAMGKETPWYFRDLSDDPGYKALIGDN